MEIKCPFCDEDDFDEIGLKYHLMYHCDVYDSIDISSIKGLFLTGVREYDSGTGGIKLLDGENSRACSCFGHKAGESMIGWICPVHGQCF